MFFQCLDLIGSLQGVNRVFPYDVAAIGLCHETGVVALATIGNQRLVHLVHLVIFLAGGQLVGHLLEDGIALGGLSEGIIVDGLVVEQVVLHALVTALVSLALHDVELLLGAFRLSELHVHLQALLGH